MIEEQVEGGMKEPDLDFFFLHNLLIKNIKNHVKI